LAANVWVVIAGATVLVSCGLATFWMAWDPCIPISGTVLLCGALMIGLSQYVAVFRGNRVAAQLIALSFICTTFGAALFLVLIVWDSFVRRGFPDVVLFLGAGLMSYSAALGWLNFQWSRKLVDWEKQVPSLEKDAQRQLGTRFHLTLREIFVLVTVLAGVFAMLPRFVADSHPQAAEHVTRTEAPFYLPKDATDACYCYGYRGTVAYEFTTSEAGFLEWAKHQGTLESAASGATLQPIVTPVSIVTYRDYLHPSGGAPSALITRGYSYEWNEEDRGVYFAYDANTGRAYYYYHGH
jgi:hypothetical protein